MKTLHSTMFALLASLACLPHAAKADVVLNIQESGSDVVAVFSGSINLLGALSLGTVSSPTVSMFPGQAEFLSLSGSSDNIYALTHISGTAFGTGTSTAGTARAGNSFGFQMAAPYMVFYLPSDYGLSGLLFGSATWANQTLASLGITPGTYPVVVANNTVTINAGAPVPEIDPAGLGSVAALITGALGLIERRRLKATAA